MHAIHVKAMAPTPTRKMRYKAVGLGLCKVVDIDHNLKPEANAMLAAQELIDDYNLQNPKSQFKSLGIGLLPDVTYAVLVTYK